MKKLVTLMVTATFFLAACGNAVDTRPEQDRFADAMAEVVCVSFEMEGMDEEVVEAKVLDVFEGYGFDLRLDGEDELDEERFGALEAEYALVPEVEEVIMEAFYECAPQDVLDMLEAYENEAMMFEDEAMMLDEEDLIIEDEAMMLDEEDLVIDVEETE